MLYARIAVNNLISVLFTPWPHQAQKGSLFECPGYIYQYSFGNGSLHQDGTHFYTMFESMTIELMKDHEVLWQQISVVKMQINYWGNNV